MAHTHQIPDKIVSTNEHVIELVKTLFPFILFLSVTELFMPISIGPLKDVDHPYITLSNQVAKGLAYLAVVVSFFYFYRLRGYLLFVFCIVSLYFGYLIFESLFLYNTFIQYNHVLQKIAELYIFFAFIVYLTNYARLNWGIIMNLLILAIVAKLVIDPSLLSLESFVNHERGLSSQVIVILTLPFFYFLNRYLLYQKTIDLVKTLFLLFILIYFQHRTIWAATFFGMLINIFLMGQKNDLRLGQFLPTFTFLTILGIFVTALVLSYFPVIGEKIVIEVGNILNPEKDDTAGWRLIQVESYLPYVQKNLLFGMRWKGFELPIQFWHTDVNVLYFEDKTGHHFHNYYFDLLFYFGIVGIIIFILMIGYPGYLLFKSNNYKSLDHIQISLYSVYFLSFLYCAAWPLSTFTFYISSLIVLTIEGKLKLR